MSTKSKTHKKSQTFLYQYSKDGVAMTKLMGGADKQDADKKFKAWKKRHSKHLFLISN